jgi:DNA mismatch endonuclease (patch repair protein)
MSRIRSKGTRIELIVRKELFRMGFRYRINAKDLPGTPDIVLPKYRTAIFVNGCFWHGHQNCKYAQVPKSNTDFWTAKIERNRVRDDEQFRQLEVLQWNVAVIWECELKKDKIKDTITKLESFIRMNGQYWEKEKEDRRKNRSEYRLRQQKAKYKKYPII